MGHGDAEDEYGKHEEETHIMMKYAKQLSLVLCLVIGGVFTLATPADAAAKKLLVSATPRFPRAFQRVHFTILTPADVDPNDLKEQIRNSPDTVAWSIEDGHWTYDTAPCAGNLRCSTMMGPGVDKPNDPNDVNAFTIKVTLSGIKTKSGGTNTYTNTFLIYPYKGTPGQRDHFTQAMLCSADELDMLANDIDNTMNMFDDFAQFLDRMFDQFNDDLDFMTNLLDYTTQIDNFMKDIDAAQNAFNSSKTKSSPTAILRMISKGIRTLMRIYREGNIAQEIKQFEDIKKRYQELADPNKSPIMKRLHSAQARIMMMQRNLSSQAARCGKQWSDTRLPK